MTTPWTGIPDDPDRSGWHWIDPAGWLEPRYWIAATAPVTIAGYWRGGSPKNPAEWLTAEVRYLGPCEPSGGPGSK
jgi:hypothetical protein